MSANMSCDDTDKCPKPNKDRCARRDHCSDPPAKTDKKVKKKFVYYLVITIMSLTKSYHIPLYFS